MKAMIFSISKYLTDTHTFWLFNIDLIIYLSYLFIYLFRPMGEAKVHAKKFKFVTPDVRKPFHYYIDYTFCTPQLLPLGYIV